MSSSGPWKVDVSRLVLTPEVRRAVVVELKERRLHVFREETRQIRFMAGIGVALESTRLRSGAGPNRDAPEFKRIRKHLEGLQKELSRLPEWQRAEFDLAAEHEARAWLHVHWKEAANAAAGESAGAMSIATDEVPFGPKTMLGRVVPISEDGINWRIGLSSDYLLDRFQWECGIFTAAASKVIASYADLPPQHNYVGPPPAIIRLIGLLGHAWRRAFDQEPGDEPNGAFGKVVTTLLSTLGIKKNLSRRSLKRALKR
ncbi:hypothetical protein ACFOYU_19330 [Microvirga sp. GCM10011540]|uniref:hypothetical protein n=1 Tax=Microvirga sp. GCM10011540 TaxID=3317338 RepID=UPI00361A2E06